MSHYKIVDDNPIPF